MSVVINDSPDIAVLDSRIIASLCEGTICVDVSPTTYIGSGKSLVAGAKVRVTNPLGVVIKDYGASQEIAPLLSGGMDAPVCTSIPTVAGAYMFGTYTVDVKMTDENGTVYTVTKTVKICPPDPKNRNKNFALLSAILNGNCQTGKVTVILDTPPNYNGTVFETQDIDVTLEYPTSSGLPVLNTDWNSFSVQLYEGVYKVNGTICARYNYGDNVYADVLYKVKKEKNVRCLIDECCVLTELANLNSQLTSNCSAQTKEQISNTIFDTLRLLKTIELTANCGEDPSDAVEELEKLLGCSCTCNCAPGTPIINNTPSGDFIIEGCNVTKETVGLTTKYTINNYEYIVTHNDNGGVLTVSGPVIDGCTVTRTITFNIAIAYTQIKSLANQNNTEADFWTSVVNKGLRDVDPSCLGVTGSVWQSWTAKQKFDAILTRVCACCGCDGEISNISLSQGGADVEVEFDVSANVRYADIYLDGVFKSRKLITGVLTNLTYIFEGAADGLEHTYTIIPICANMSVGTMATDDFIYSGCPSIEPPSLSTDSVVGTECPFDLDTITTPPPVGITVEWHNANNTNNSSIVGNPNAVSSGTYYAFAKDADGCYSLSSRVTVVCDAGSSCSAPQNLTVDVPVPGSIRILFQSAAFPPPGNSYTVKRKAAADPDIDGSYTTIGTPIFNSSLNRWQIFDTSYSQNTLYTYKAVSNCGGSPDSTPGILYNFADIACASAVVTPDTDSVDFSLDTTGSNEIDQYIVGLYDASGTILISSQTFTPAFANPITGTFTYLTEGTTYKIKVTACIGSFCKTSCSTTTFVTDESETENFTLNAANGMNITAVTGTGVPSMPVVNSPGHAAGHHSGLPATAISVTLTGTPGTTCKLTLYVAGNPDDCVAVPGAGTYALTPLDPVVEAEAVIISVEIGTC